jgi:selT/selW/selH-like putative selenoprotein
VDVAVEHCRSWQVFKKRAIELCDQLKKHFPRIQFNISYNNGITPRRGAFELTVKKGGADHLIWTGLKKGPPRKEKFPAIETLVDLFKSNIF